MPTEDKLKIAGLPLKEILRNLPVGMFIVEKSSGKVIYANKRAIDLYGVNPVGLRKPGPFRLLRLDGEVYPTPELSASRALLKGETVRNQDLIVEQPNSKRVIITDTAIPIKNRKGEIIGALVIFEDITERKQMQEKLEEYSEKLELLVEERTKKICESEQSYRELYESFGEAFMATDWELNVIHWNKVAERVTKVNAIDALGKKIYDVLPEMASVDVAPYYEALIKRKSARFMMNTVSRETGQEAIFEVSTYPSTLGIIIIVEDKTEEERTKRLSAIGQTAGMIGHDIRNPLQAIISDVYLLKADLATMPESETKKGVAESLDGIEKNIGYINKIVADLQDYARPLNPEYCEVDLSNLTGSVFQTISLPDNIKLSINIKVSNKLKTDPEFVRRILTNLVNNAIQAMPKGGKLELAGFLKDNRVCISVSDTGIGISEELKPKLFTPMVTTKAKGQGLGLAVVKRVIEALNGTITFESQEGKGTKFIIELPLSAV
jgi:PAS domain S-box-containing protein